jgi:curved DNA-binding protein
MAVQFKDYYEILGVTKNATEDEIRKAFRKLARQHHPDVAKDKKAAEEKFKEINEAYEVLGDPEKRKKYDTLGSDWERGGGFQTPPGWHGRTPGGGVGGEDFEFQFGGTGFSDFFEAFFGSRGRQHPFEGYEEPPQHGNDIEVDIMVTLEEAARGSKRKISFRRSKAAKVETYEVRIPPGVHEGQRIRLAGQGEPGARGASPGDLYLRVRFAQHPDLRVEGSDLIYEASIPPWRMVLGCEITAPTLEGSARLKIPPGTQNGQRFRLRQKGLSTATKTRGDLYVVARVKLPAAVTPRERELWEQLGRESSGSGSV